MKKNLFVIVVIFGFVISCDRGKLENQPIETQNAGEAYIEKIGQIDLKIGNGPVLGMVQYCIICNESILVVDFPTTNLVYQYDLNGEFIRTIGSNGNGPGEYLSPYWVTTDKLDNIYVLDGSAFRLNVYDKYGNFTENIFRNAQLADINLDKFFVDDAFNLIVLEFNRNRIPVLTKVRRSDYKKLYSVELASQEYCVLGNFMSVNGFFYNPSTNKAYHILPSDYHVKEIDTNNGQIVRMFGYQPENYTPLDNKYLGISNPKRELVEEISKKTSCIHIDALLVLDNKYLLVGFGGSKEFPIPEYFLYDMSSDSIRTFDVYWIPFNLYKVAYKNNNIYSYRQPEEKEVDVINGSIDILKLKFGVKKDKIDLNSLIKNNF